jgi:MoxR-like ATPase
MQTPELDARGDEKPLRGRLARLLTAVTEGLVERDDTVRAVLLAALAGEHVLLLGPPGTAKSEIARRLRHAFTGGTFFERLLTRFSVPEEVFGPLSLKALENDAYVRLTDGYLPKANIAFLDEVFKANSAILNALLGILNEREFDNGASREPVPLIAVIGASNEVPGDDELRALYDRFLVRRIVDPVSASGFEALLEAPPTSAGTIDPGDRLDRATLEEIQRGSSAVALSPGVLALLGALRAWCQKQSIYVSDRRWLKIVRLLRVAASTDGRRAVLLQDAWLLEHLVWDRPEQIAEVKSFLLHHIAVQVNDDPERLARMVDAFEIWGETGGGRHKTNDAGQALYLDEDGMPTTERLGRQPAKDGEGKQVYVAPMDKTRPYSIPELWRSEFALHGDLDLLESYIKNPENWFYATANRQPIVEPDPDAEVRLPDQLRQMDELAASIDASLIAIEQARTPASAPLWIPSERLEMLLRDAAAGAARLTTARARLTAVRERIGKATER